PTQRRHRARVYLNLGPALRAASRLSEAEAACREAIRLFDDLIGEQPARFDFQFEQAAAQINLGLVRRSAGDPAAARAALTRGLAELLVGLKASPGEPAFRQSLRQQVRDLPGLLVWAGDHDGARRLARTIAAALPDRADATRWAVALLAGCVAA